MDVVTKEIIAIEAYNVCQQIQVDPTAIPPWTEVALIIGTASVENGFKVSPTGPGLGVFGIPIERGLQVYSRFEHSATFSWSLWKRNKQAAQMWSVFSKAWLGVSSVPWINLSKQDLRYLLTHDIRFAAAVCRWYYIGYPGKAPENLTEVADEWGVFFRNVSEGTNQGFMKAWTDNDCMDLMHLVGYQ